MFRYRLYTPDGDEIGEATYAQMIHAARRSSAGKNQHFRVVDVVVSDEEKVSPFVGIWGPSGRIVRLRTRTAHHRGARGKA